MRSPSTWLPLGAAVLLAIWLVLPAGGGLAQDSGAEVDSVAPTSEPGLLAAPALPAAAGSGPVLASGGRSPRWPSEVHSAMVTVRSPSGTVRAGLPVRIREPGASQPIRYRLTDAVGAVRLTDVPLDGSVIVEALSMWGERPGRIVGSLALTAPVQDLVCTGSMPLDVRVLDAVTGRPIDLDVPATRRPAALSDAAGVGLLPGERATVGLQAPAAASEAWRAQGYVAWEVAQWKSTISRYARRLSLDYPLRRSARVQVFAQEHDGTPTDRALIAGFEVAGRTVGERFSISPHRGGFLLQGVPFLRNEPLKVLVVRPPPEEAESHSEGCFEIEVSEVEEAVEEELAYEESFAFSERHPGAAIGSGRLPQGWHEWLVVNALFPADAEEDVLWGRSGSVEICCSSNCRRHTEGPKGAVAVTVHRRDGRPAVGAWVTVGAAYARTDLRGQAVLRDVLPGEHEIRLREPGLVTCSRTVAVRADRTTRASLREPGGATVKIRVVGSDGKGLPFATLSLPGGAAWVDLDEAGVQRLDPFTDVEGRRTLEHFPAGTWRFAAQYGSRSAGVEAKVRPGGVQTVTLTLPSPPQPR